MFLVPIGKIYFFLSLEPSGEDVVSEEHTPIEDKSTLDSSWTTASDRHSPRDHTPHVHAMKTKKMVLEPG